MQKFVFHDEVFVRHEDVLKFIEGIKINLRQILNQTYDGCQRNCLDCGAANEQAFLLADKVKYFEMSGIHSASGQIARNLMT